jgi:hypothetical protein
MYHLFKGKIQKAIAQGCIFSGIPYTTQGQNAYAGPGIFLKPVFLHYSKRHFPQNKQDNLHYCKAYKNILLTFFSSAL